MIEGLEKFTEQARLSLQYARSGVQQFGHDYIGTEHILLGLLSVSDSLASRVLNSCGIDEDRVRSMITHIIGYGEPGAVADIGLTLRSRHVIEIAEEEARRLQNGSVGTEHLLLGLLREDQAIAASLIESLGASLEQVRTATLDMLNAEGSSSDPMAAR
jgi:ATP-dependent Clp protease ATP-binding subunit ClpC